jgi:hypothetical protein
VQLATLFQMLRDERPMNDFESKFKIYDFLTVPDLPRVHWSDGAGWLMAEHMYDLVKKNRAMLADASYLSLIADGTTAVDNCSYIYLFIAMFYRIGIVCLSCCICKRWNQVICIL